MFRLIKKYYRQSWRMKVLLLYIFILLGIVRLFLLIIPFRYIAGYLGHITEESPYSDMSQTQFLRRIAWSLTAVSRYTPWESKCLVQAIVGKILLRHRHLPNTLYLGVCKDKDNNLQAHAWLRSGSYTITGGWAKDNFTVVSMFSDMNKHFELRRNNPEHG